LGGFRERKTKKIATLSRNGGRERRLSGQRASLEEIIAARKISRGKCYHHGARTGKRRAEVNPIAPKRNGTLNGKGPRKGTEVGST